MQSTQPPRGSAALGRTRRHVNGTARQRNWPGQPAHGHGHGQSPQSARSGLPAYGPSGREQSAKQRQMVSLAAPGREAGRPVPWKSDPDQYHSHHWRAFQVR